MAQLAAKFEQVDASLSETRARMHIDEQLENKMPPLPYVGKGITIFNGFKISMKLFFMGSLHNLLGLVILHVCTNLIIDDSPVVSLCHVAVKIKVLCMSSPVR